MAFATIKLVLLLVFCGASLAGQCPKLTTVPDFQIEKYTGIWYDVSRLPNLFLLGVKCDNATYTLNPNGTVALLNQGVGLLGRPSGVGGLLTVIDPAVPGAFRVVFSNSVVDTYNVLATDYVNYASVYSCSIIPILRIKLEYGFILSREKTLKPELLQKARKAFTNNGINVNKFFTVRQDC